ncbi:L domain-like protein [Dioscorea alata]|uniref:L domain-like protein n=1 Tax=Dioscorea alata TaxID=55571 RepID=A0ACB7TXV0_DIOAL|nr:L domain-like protein [Dioscorea alata]
MAIVTGDRYIDSLVRFVDRRADSLLDGSLTLRLNPLGLRYVQSRLDALQELEGLLAGAPVDYLRAYVSDLGDHRALEQLRRILGLLTSLKVVSVLPPPARDPTPLSLVSFGRLKVLELRGCDLSTSAAKGLLELRGCLEKLICHNSTDALRHVFASRIVDIKDSPVWSRLSFVSCACNGLVLMDESLQLLPVVQTLDLSRNSFAKVDNLRNCTKLRHLDLGFNHLRTIASLSEVSCPIVKLVLRNNALTILRGIENLKSVQGLDLSYNIISSFSELEILASLTCLQDLWLEGNPVCCARWYRSHVYSFFSRPEKLKLDDKGISTREYWERNIILASRQKQPAGHGFYFPAKHDFSNDSSIHLKRKKNSRLACIEDEEQRRYLLADALDQESASCDSDNARKDEHTISDGETEIVNLRNRVECLKKERSVLWLREFKEWMDQSTMDTLERSNCMEFKTVPSGEEGVQQRTITDHFGESSRYVQDPVLASEGGSSSNILDSDMSFTDTHASVPNTKFVDTNGKAILEPLRVNGTLFSINASGEKIAEATTDQGHRKSHLPMKGVFLYGSSSVEGSDQTESKNYSAPLTVIDEIIGSRSSSTLPGSPPQYKEDILHRRLNLEEEFWQQSAESLSLASSDSDTSCSDDESCKFDSSAFELYPSSTQELVKQPTSAATSATDEVNHDERRHDHPYSKHDISSCEEKELRVKKQLSPNCDEPISNHNDTDVSANGVNQKLNQNIGSMKNVRGKQKLRRRLISLLDNFRVSRKVEESQNHNQLEVEEVDMEAPNHLVGNENSTYISVEETDVILSHNCASITPTVSYSSLLKTEPNSLEPVPVEAIREFFHVNIADSDARETCEALIRCDCAFQLESAYQEREIAILRSSKSRLYLLPIDGVSDGRGTRPTVLGCYSLEDIREIVVGLALQALRIHMEGNINYLFLTRTIDKARDLLCLLLGFDSRGLQSNGFLRSWEKVQIKMLEKHVHENLKIGIHFYSTLLLDCGPPAGKVFAFVCLIK